MRPGRSASSPSCDTALDLLDAAAEGAASSRPGRNCCPSDIAAAIAWGFCRFVIPEFAPEERWPALAAQARACEALDVFKAWPIDREEPEAQLSSGRNSSAAARTAGPLKEPVLGVARIGMAEAERGGRARAGDRRGATGRWSWCARSRR